MLPASTLKQVYGVRPESRSSPAQRHRTGSQLSPQHQVQTLEQKDRNERRGSVPPPEPVVNYDGRSRGIPVEGGTIAHKGKRNHEQIEAGMLPGIIPSVDKIHFPVQKTARQPNVIGACIYDDKPSLRQETL